MEEIKIVVFSEVYPCSMVRKAWGARAQVACQLTLNLGIAFHLIAAHLLLTTMRTSNLNVL
jgi:hypothetical protein